MFDVLIALLATAGVSMVPALELRAGIPLGLALGLPPAVATAASVLGNLVQIQVAMAVVRAARRYGDRFPQVARWLAKVERQALPHAPLLSRYGWIGLALFVLLPLPGTGVWGGAVLAHLLRLNPAATWLGLGTGVALSGAVMGLGWAGVLSGFRYFFRT